jgi:UDP-N-acetylglucosamine 4-epimerase
VTGVAGFIGSNLLERLLALGQRVVGLDNFSTGQKRNLSQVESIVGVSRWSQFRFMLADIQDIEACRQACEGVDIVLHQAALGSVPRSIQNPIATNQSNVDGFLNMLVAAKDAGVQRFVYAASSSSYGDHPDLPKREDIIGRPLSPYAVTKIVNEMYADVFSRTYGLQSIGLRYFNVFGRRQNPNGEYAAVIPRWISALMEGKPVIINGDGSTTRDFCYVDNAVQANILAGMVENEAAINRVYNIAVGNRTSLLDLFEFLRVKIGERNPCALALAPDFRSFRPGDVRHSQADISKARQLLGYEPTHGVFDGLSEAMVWYADNLQAIGLK